MNYAHRVYRCLDDVLMLYSIWLCCATQLSKPVFAVINKSQVERLRRRMLKRRKGERHAWQGAGARTDACRLPAIPCTFFPPHPTVMSPLKARLLQLSSIVEVRGWRKGEHAVAKTAQLTAGAAESSLWRRSRPRQQRDRFRNHGREAGLSTPLLEAL
jgi:hypothetical protein